MPQGELEAGYRAIKTLEKEVILNLEPWLSIGIV